MSTTGIELKTQRRALAEVVELISSMRFAITLLMMVAIAAVIGTVMKQGEPMPNYVNQFGPFWFEFFNKIGLYAVYSSWWFLLIMGFLVTSTSLCIIRNAPKMLKDARSWRQNVREESLRNFHHKMEWLAPLNRAALAEQTAMRLRHGGYAAKIVEKDGGLLVAAKRGAGNKFGYIFAHTAIVLICVGGLLDSDLPIRAQQWFFGKEAFSGNGAIPDLPKHRLGLSNPTFRGNTQIAEGSTSNVAILQQPNGVLVQDLPFTILLKHFQIDFYSTGMPKLFASEVVVKDHETGKTFPATIKVNEPLIYKGIAVYQSSFDDGGSKLKLAGYPMQGASGETFEIKGEVGGATVLKRGNEEFDVEWSGFRPFNVENLAGSDLRAVKRQDLLGSAAKDANNKDLKNVGPSLSYKLRDKTGQAREFNNYMQPVLLDGASVFLAGMRTNPGDPYNYLRIPSDDDLSVKEWMRLRAALFDPALRELATRRYAQRAMPANASSPALVEQLRLSSVRSLDIFVGDGKLGGFVAVSRFLEKIPQAEQEKAAAVFMKLLNGTLWELWSAAREQDKLAPVVADDKHGQFLQLSINALSDSFFYGAPVYLQLEEFEEIKASVLQVTRSPGKNVVYFGCFLLILGVFSMFYIRDRRIWVWLRDTPEGAHALMAMSTQRKTLDFEQEFKNWTATLPQSA